jgi:hypothetical protein
MANLLTGPIDALATLVAASTSFQSFVGAANATAAAARVHKLDLPRPEGESYTLDELSTYRPLAIVDMERGGGGWEAVEVAKGGGIGRFRTGGRLMLCLERSVPPGLVDDNRAADADFMTAGRGDRVGHAPARRDRRRHQRLPLPPEDADPRRPAPRRPEGGRDVGRLPARVAGDRLGALT